MKKYRHKKDKSIHTLIKTSTDQERGYTYYYMERDGNVLSFGSKVFKDLFEDIGDEA